MKASALPGEVMLMALLVPTLTAGPRPAGSETGSIQIAVDTSRNTGSIDLTRYALGQGGLSAQPMISDRIEQVRQLHPQTINFFLQEYFNIYPAHHRFNWVTLDKAIEAVEATGAKPIMNLTLKPKVLYPKIDAQVTDPTDYAEWEELIYQLVRHCNDRNYGITYWLVENEGDIGEMSGCPYKFTPESYLRYYQHTVSAIRRADPKAKVGGPAPAAYENFGSPFVDALTNYAAREAVPFDFLCFHGYNNDPRWFRELIEHMKDKLAAHPQLSHVETMIDQWNIDLGNPNQNPDYQPAFILETTQTFYQAGLTRSSYYQIRDYFVDPKEFLPFFSPPGTTFMAHWWNEMPQYDGLYDNQDRLRPAYYAFRLLSLIKGDQLPVTGTSPSLNALAARGGPWVNVLLWNFPLEGEGKTADVTVQFPFEKQGAVRLVRLNAAAPVNNLEQIRNTKIADLQAQPLRLSVRPYEIYWIEVTE
jgi:hypothetical protein